MKFSERHGYLKPSDVIIKERITPDIQNAICNCFLELVVIIDKYSYRELERYIQRYFFNLAVDSIPQLSIFNDKNTLDDSNYKHYVILPFLKNSEKEWFEKIDILESTLKYLNTNKETAAERFVCDLNSEFTRLNFGYRIIDGLITEITSELEIKTIEKALEDNKDNVRMHLNKALEFLSMRPIGDYRNSIKESISAVEALNREITGEKSLNLNKMESRGLKIPSILREAFNKLYGYTNHAETGIRHALMDETAEYVPGAEEALYMLITCSAFINYLNSKLKLEINNND